MSCRARLTAARHPRSACSLAPLSLAIGSLPGERLKLGGRRSRSTRDAEDTVALITTAGAGNRRQYEQDLLTCAGSPAQHHATFSYRGKYVSDEVLRHATTLAGKRALVVFAYPDGSGSMVFHPLRWVTILECAPKQLVANLCAEKLKSHDLSIRFVLGDLVAIRPDRIAEAQQACKTWLSTAPHHAEHAARIFVDKTSELFKPDFNPAAAGSKVLHEDPEVVWLTHAEAITEVDFLRDATLFQAKHPAKVRLIRKPKAVAYRKRNRTGRDYPMYKFVTRKQYILDVYTYTRSVTPTRRAMNAEQLMRVRAPQSLISQNHPALHAVGRENHARIFIHAEPVSVSEIATLILEGTDGEQGDRNRANRTFRLSDLWLQHSSDTVTSRAAPRIEFLARVTPGLPSLILGLGLVAAGLAAAATSLHDIQSIDEAVTLHWAMLIKLGGAALAGAGSWLAFRRTRPSS